MPDCRLYLITPPAIPDLPAFAEALKRALGAGDVAALQLRLKDVPDADILRVAAALRPIAHAHDVALLMNDRMDLAKQAGCDGVHLGQADGDPVAARRLLGAEAMIGVTCHASRHLAMEAGDAGADYVAFGAFFPTGTKQTSHVADIELLEWWSEMFEIPAVAIGGIKAQNCAPLVRAGVDFLAVVGAVWNHQGGPDAGVRAMNAAIAEA